MSRLAREISSEDLVDILWETLKLKGSALGPRKAAVPRGGRVFLSEYEIKRMIEGNGILRVPENAILSPLAQDWMTLKGIRVVREVVPWR